MESNSGVAKKDDHQMELELPPGFRFHPTDEELITHYLSNKAVDCNFSAIAMGEVDMNRIEPWDLPWKAKLGEKEWYFFCVRDKKYPTGMRTNRATPSGYWKATGKDKEIFRGKNLVGMKKTLVFYMGRAPRGEKSGWVCHEYRLEGRCCPVNLPKSSRNDWVISRVFCKTANGKKVHKTGLRMKMDPGGNDLAPSALPPLMDPDTNSIPQLPESSHVHCFSNAGPHKIEDEFQACLDFSLIPPPGFPWGQFPGSFQPGVGFQVPGSGTLQDGSILRSFLASYGDELDQGMRKDGEIVSPENSSVVSNVEVGKKALEEQENLAIGQQDLDSIWSY